MMGLGNQWIMVGQVFMITSGRLSVASNCWFNMRFVWEQLLREELDAGYMDRFDWCHQNVESRMPYSGAISSMSLASIFSEYLY